jgi:hypothetical protein
MATSRPSREQNRRSAALTSGSHLLSRLHLWPTPTRCSSTACFSCCMQLVSHGDEEDGVARHKQLAFLRSLSPESSQRMLVSANKRHQLTQPASLNSSPSFYHYRAGGTAKSPSVSRGTRRLRLPTFGRCGKQSKRISLRYLRFLAPLCQRNWIRCVTLPRRPPHNRYSTYEQCPPASMNSTLLHLSA